MRITAEPGRSIVAAAAITLYRVGTVKSLPGLRETARFEIVVWNSDDAGIGTALDVIITEEAPAAAVDQSRSSMSHTSM